MAVNFAVLISTFRDNLHLLISPGSVFTFKTESTLFQLNTYVMFKYAQSDIFI